MFVRFLFVQASSMQNAVAFSDLERPRPSRAACSLGTGYLCLHLLGLGLGAVLCRLSLPGVDDGEDAPKIASSPLDWPWNHPERIPATAVFLNPSSPI